MPDSTAKTQAKPVLCRTATTVSLHFSWHETQSCMDLRHPDALHLEYTRTMMGFLLFIPEPRSVTMVGLGGGSLAKFCHRHLPKARIQVIEINPHVIALRDEFHVPADSRRFVIVEGDGAEFVRSPPRRSDVLLVDGYDDQGLPTSLGSQRFYDDCREMLEPDGMLVVNLHCSQVRWQQQIARIGRSFNGAILTVDDDDGSNSVVFASTAYLADRSNSRPMRRPRNLDHDAWAQLRGTFSRVLAAANDEQS
ncbi:MAG: fused MFS/spermidine synthase [Chromatiales bacterium]|nr:fused MFS/spermidine synthase [Chromatiales bacterium]